MQVSKKGEGNCRRVARAAAAAAGISIEGRGQLERRRCFSSRSLRAFFFPQEPPATSRCMPCQREGSQLEGEGVFSRARKSRRGDLPTATPTKERQKKEKEREKKLFLSFSHSQLTGRSAGRDTRPGRRSDARTRQVRRGGESRLHFGASRARAGGGGRGVKKNVTLPKISVVESEE